MADLIARLKLESGEYDSKIKRATQGLLQMEQECRNVGGTLAVLEKDQKDFVQALGRMETVSKTARGRLSELSSAYTDLAVQYRRLTDEEKKGDYGKALNSSLTQLKGRLNDAKKELAEVESEMKGASSAGIDFNSVLASLGQRFGINSELMGALTTGTIATTAAVTAGAAAVAAATKMWADYNDELNRQANVTTVTTGLKGDDAENLTIGVRALAKTYDVDFREAINAANMLIQQFGVSGERALSLLQDGMQGMIAGDGGKLLSMIQQYAPSFRDAGISASQLVAVIQNTEGGIFTDQNMQAIVMGIRNIRLMTKQTSDALAQLGIDGQEMSRKLEDGSMTIFDALRQVSDAIDNVDSGSKAAGEVMQSVFGRQGTMAGTKLGEAIATLNTNLEETKTQTGELGESFVRLNEANMRLENTMKDVFGMTGWEDMNNLIKTDLANTLSDVIGFLGDIKNALQDLNNVKSFDTLVHAIVPWQAKLLEVTGALDYMKKQLVELGVLQKDVKPAPSAPAQNGYKVTTDSSGKVVKATRVVNGEETDDTENYKKAHPDKKTKPIITKTTIPKVGSNGSKKETWAPIEKADLTLGMQKVQKVVEVTVDDSAALEQLRGIEGVTIDGKTFSVTATDAEALAKLNEIEGITIDDKTMTVMADTADALRALQGIEGVTIDPKTVTITATDEALPKLREIEGITIDDKTMTVTADTADALRALQGIEGVTIDPKTVTITATDEALPKLREIEGITIDDKTMTVTADTADALRALQGIEGVTIDPKTLTVIVTNDEAMSKLKEIEGVKLSDKVIDVVVNDNSDFLFGRSRQDVQKDLQRAQKAYDVAPDEWTRAEAKKDVTRYKNELETINSEGDVTKGLLKDAYTHDFSKEIDKLNKELKKDNDMTQATGMEQVKQMGAMLGGIQQMVGGIEMLGLDIPEGFQSMLKGMQGIMAILEAIQTINTAGTILGIFGNGGIVKAANGMIVPGNSYSGDNLRMPVGAGGGFIGINSGELILSRAQQDVIAGALGGVGEQSVNYADTPYVDGEKIFLGVNNFLRRSGRGEIVTSRR